METKYPKVLIIGVGRVGHACLHLLTSQGFGEFVLVDPDVVEVKNIPDTRYRREDIGRSKVEASAAIALKANPEAKIKILGYAVEQEHFAWLLSATGLANGYAVAIFAFDDPQALLAANRALYARLPIVFPGVHANARTGHVIYTIPGVTPCIACAMGEGAQNVRQPLRQLRANEALFGVEASDRLAWCVYEIILEIAGLRRQRLVQPRTRRTVLFLRENLTEGVWWRTRHVPRCRICPERR